MKVEGYTAEEMAEKLEITYENVRHRISELDIKTIIKAAIYPLDTLEKIKKFGSVGRPKKATPEPAKPESKSKKAKK
jgi:predicted ArsR family transcriptional regulator